MYRPKEPFTTTIKLFNPTYEEVDLVKVKKYPTDGEIINCSFKTYGGTEKVDNGVLSVTDTAVIETWYREDITSNSIITLNDNKYEVIGVPEDIDQRHQFIKFKVRSINGGA